MSGAVSESPPPICGSPFGCPMDQVNSVMPSGAKSVCLAYSFAASPVTA